MDEMDDERDEREFAEAIWGPDFRPAPNTRTVFEGEAVQVVVTDGLRMFRGYEFEAVGMAVIRREDGQVLDTQIYGGQNAHAHGIEMRESVERMAQAICAGEGGDEQ